MQNADMNKKGMLQISFTNITENSVEVLLRADFVKNVRKYIEINKYFLTLQYRRNRKGSYNQTTFFGAN